MQAVRAISPLAGQAIEDYYEPSTQMSTAQLWHLTEAGRAMLEDNPQKLHPQQLFDNRRKEQHPSANLDGLIRKAAQQADEVFAFACSTWNSFGALVDR
jgi:hypothetical protein